MDLPFCELDDGDDRAGSDYDEGEDEATLSDHAALRDIKTPVPIAQGQTPADERRPAKAVSSPAVEGRNPNLRLSNASIVLYYRARAFSSS